MKSYLILLSLVMTLFAQEHYHYHVENLPKPIQKQLRLLIKETKMHKAHVGCHLKCLFDPRNWKTFKVCWKCCAEKGETKCTLAETPVTTTTTTNTNTNLNTHSTTGV